MAARLGTSYSPIPLEETVMDLPGFLERMGATGTAGVGHLPTPRIRGALGWEDLARMFGIEIPTPTPTGAGFFGTPTPVTAPTTAPMGGAGYFPAMGIGEELDEVEGESILPGDTVGGSYIPDFEPMFAGFLGSPGEDWESVYGVYGTQPMLSGPGELPDWDPWSGWEGLR